MDILKRKRRRIDLSHPHNKQDERSDAYQQPKEPDQPFFAVVIKKWGPCKPDSLGLALSTNIFPITILMAVSAPDGLAAGRTFFQHVKLSQRNM
jgi:hypothetical protein